MGKKKGASTSGAAKVSRDWSASAISNRDINKLRALGFISASEDDIRLPGAVSRPKPPKGFTVMFTAFLFRGLSLPAHEFLRSLLFFYGIQLWQLTPNSILHLSIFITVCEAFLGIDPHWGLWRKIFYVKRHNDSNGPPVRWRWFYLRDPSVSGRCSNLPPFDDKLIAKPKKSWQNTLSPDERLTADRLFDQIVTLKNTGGLTMCGTEVVSVFLQRRVQPLMSRPHQLWLYTGKDDESRVSSADLSAEDLRDEVRRLTCLSMKDNIVLTSARSPYDSDHPPTEALAAARCYPPTPESGVVLEDDDEDSDGTEDAPHVLEDSDVQGEEATEDDAFVRSRRRKQVHDDLITSAESSPRGGDNDADEAAAPPPAKKSSTSFFAGEDDLDLSDDDDDEVPLAKRAKFVSERAASAKESNPSPAKSTPPSRTVVEKVPVSTVIPPGDVPASSAGRDHVLEANRLATDAKNENVSLKEEVKRLKQRLKDEHDAKRAAAAAIDKKEGVLRESIKDLLVVASDVAEENKKIHEEVEAMTDVAHPNHGLWLHRPKAVVMAKFKYRVGKAHYYFDKFHAHLTMVWNTLFPLDQAPETLSALFTRFKSPERIRQLVRKELLAGAELAFASILACHPSLDLGAVANTEKSLGQYYDAARGPAYTIVSRMESCLEKDLKAHWDRGARL
ncbi:hypothetical protein QYE76_032190 [Lolium multiflorum]|uniref:Transposase (putative) gypsy type domain-containing protein n=1 Tax=Lolium multiflorum TaxID=4521 RepID=A0AAD8QVB4_LOLMU|nr:hypothetical protein QYE76_032190 [Lolium multiflorum]